MKIFKHGIILLLIIVLFSSCSGANGNINNSNDAVPADSATDINYNTQEQQSTKSPDNAIVKIYINDILISLANPARFNVEGKTVYPVDGLKELGIDYELSGNSVIASKDDNTVTIPGPTTIDGVSYIGLNSIVENFCYDFVWDADNRAGYLYIMSNEYNEYTDNTAQQDENITEPEEPKTTEIDKYLLIDIVRNGFLLQYSNVPLGRAFDDFFSNVNWNAAEYEGSEYVLVEGTILLFDEAAHAEVIYRVDSQSRTFYYDSVYIDDVEVSQVFYRLLEYKVMDEYIYGNDTAENMLIKAVKNNYLYAYPDIPLGFALENWLGYPTWEAIYAEDGNYYVNAYGVAELDGKNVDVILQYLIKDDDTFEFNALEIDGHPQTLESYLAFIDNVMGSMEVIMQDGY